MLLEKFTLLFMLIQVFQMVLNGHRNDLMTCLPVLVSLRICLPHYRAQRLSSFGNLRLQISKQQCAKPKNIFWLVTVCRLSLVNGSVNPLLTPHLLSTELYVPSIHLPICISMTLEICRSLALLQKF